MCCEGIGSHVTSEKVEPRLVTLRFVGGALGALGPLSVLKVNNELFGPLPIRLKALMVTLYSVSSSKSVNQTAVWAVLVTLIVELVPFSQNTS